MYLLEKIGFLMTWLDYQNEKTCITLWKENKTTNTFNQPILRIWNRVTFRNLMKVVSCYCNRKCTSFHFAILNLSWKVKEGATITSRSQPMAPRGRDKDTNCSRSRTLSTLPQMRWLDCSRDYKNISPTSQTTNQSVWFLVWFWNIDKKPGWHQILLVFVIKHINKHIKY